MDGEGEIVQAARWLAGEFFRVMAAHVEGKTTGWPTVPEACERFSVKDDVAVVRLAEELLRQALADLPPITGRLTFDLPPGGYGPDQRRMWG